jgi:hypothetical protein
VSSWPARLVKGFARFWWDFLVGDTPEVFAAVVVVLGLVALLSVAWHENALAVVVFPVLVVATLAATLFQARR